MWLWILPLTDARRLYLRHAWSPEAWSVGRTSASSAQNCWDTSLPSFSAPWCNLSSFLQTQPGFWGHPLELWWRKRHVKFSKRKTALASSWLNSLYYFEVMRLTLWDWHCKLLLAFMNKCVCAQLLSRVWLCVTPQTAVCQAPLPPFTGFFWPAFWSGLPVPSLGDLPDPGIEPAFPASPVLQENSLPLSHGEVLYE